MHDDVVAIPAIQCWERLFEKHADALEPCGDGFAHVKACIGNNGEMRRSHFVRLTARECSDGKRAPKRNRPTHT